MLRAIPLPADDPRLQPGAYVQNGRKLCEVLHVSQTVSLLDCRTDAIFAVSRFLFAGDWALVRGPEAQET